MGTSTILDPKDLFVNLIKDFLEEILAEVENKDSIFKSYQTDEMDSFEDLEKDKSTEEKGEMIKSKDLVKTDDASCRVINKFDSKNEEKVETLPMEPKEIIEAPKEEAMDLNIDLTEPAITKVFVAYYNLDKTIEETYNSTKFDPNKVQKNKFEVLLKEVTTEYDALIQELPPKKKKQVQELHAPEMENIDETYMVGSYYKKEVRNKDKKTKVEGDKRVHDSLQDSADMDCTSRMKLEKVENDDSDNNDANTWTSEPRKEKKETVLIETEKIVDAKTQEENNRRALMEDEEESIKWWHNDKRSLNENTLNRACEAWSTRKAHKILEWSLKSAKTSNGRIGTKDVKKKKKKSKNWNDALYNLPEACKDELCQENKRPRRLLN
ncbi:hypothetical protein F8M41_025101 [Gigaspora margarita]|uniref:Uncharacterized protein n=1 Tax=Gigaspora margarita TaxID=4874 RepID=A0A8H3XJ13_GIGMA|nr:hypothetical protein F8M41_025101 [Gigaspora margarita]